MPRNYVRLLGARKYADYTKEKLQACLNAIKNGELTQRKAAAVYNIPRSTLKNKLKGLHSNKPGQPPIFTHDQEMKFVDCCITMGEYGFPVDPFELRCIIKLYLERQGRKVRKFKNNMPGCEWIRSFLKRHPRLTLRFASNISQKRASTDENTIKSYVANLSKVLKDIPPSNIWNFDETNLTDDPGKKRVLIKKGSKYPERICNTTKTSTSLMFCGNAVGELLPPYIVYKSDCLWDLWTENGPPGCRYNRSKSGWFDAAIFEDWFISLFLPHLKKQHGKKVIICDNLSSHINEHILKLCHENEISFVCLPPHSTHLTQPLDVAFFRPLKGNWRKLLSEWKESPNGNSESTLPKRHFPGLLKQLMESIEPSKAENLRAGFKKCGVVPVDVDILLERLPNTNQNVPFDSVLLEHLQSKRVSTSDNKRVPRKKKINVEAGKSISISDVNNPVQIQLAPKRIATGILSTSSSESDDNNYSLHDSSDSDGPLQFSDEELNGEGSHPQASTSAAMVASNKSPYEVGDFVIFVYEGAYFPGKILEIRKNGAIVSSMQKTLKSWKWPDKQDAILYSWVEIVQKINPPEKCHSKREFFQVPEILKYWEI